MKTVRSQRSAPYAMKRRVNLLVGSGVSEYFKLPGTDAITEAVLAIDDTMYDDENRQYANGLQRGVRTIYMVRRGLLSYFDKVTFELLLHAVETLMSIGVGGKGYDVSDLGKPMFNAFMDVAPRWDPLVQYGRWPTVARLITARIIDTVSDACKVKTREQLVELTKLISALRARVEINCFSLNYDDLFERAVDGWFDGFEEGKQVARFDVPSFNAAYRQTQLLCHLHGCINYGVSSRENSVEIVKYRRPYVAMPPLLPAFSSRAQSGEMTVIGPIISGLRKTDKMYFAPYGYYQQAFVEGLTAHPRVLIVGYGGRDTYVNNWLWQAGQIHREDFRVCIVTKCTNEQPEENGGIAALCALLTGTDEERWYSRLRADLPGATHDGLRLVTTGFPISEADYNAAMDYLCEDKPSTQTGTTAT